MIALFHYKSPFGGQYSIRAGSASELAYQIFFRDGLKMILDEGFNTRNKKLKAQFEYAEQVYQAQCNNTITLDMIKEYNFNTDIGGFECLGTIENSDEIETFVNLILELTKNKRAHDLHTEETVQIIITLIKQIKDGETKELVSQINAIHHVL